MTFSIWSSQILWKSDYIMRIVEQQLCRCIPVPLEVTKVMFLWELVDLAEQETILVRTYSTTCSSQRWFLRRAVDRKSSLVPSDTHVSLFTSQTMWAAFVTCLQRKCYPACNCSLVCSETMTFFYEKGGWLVSAIILQQKWCKFIYLFMVRGENACGNGIQPSQL